MFDSRQLRTFHAVVETGSFSAAARSLGYTQPAVSQQMRSLERAAGSPLFAKAGRGVRLTEAGQSLSRHAAVILESIGAAEQHMEAIRRLRSGRVRVCAFPSASATLLPGAVARLTDDHPELRVELVEDEPPESLRRVVRGDCDLALAFSYPGLPDQVPEALAEIPLLDDRLVVLLPAGHPLARRRVVRLAELGGERWIAGCPRCRANFVHACAEAGFTPDIAFATDDNLVVQALVASGVGIALAPALVLAFLRHPKVTGREVSPAAGRKVSAYVLREHLRIPATGWVVEALRGVAGAAGNGGS
jgi:DNA-binding transcriptional LysR family regulator